MTSGSSWPTATYTTLRVEEIEPDIVLVTFAMPERLNSMTVAFARELVDVFDALAEAPEARVVILTGEGRGFSSGHDLEDLGDGEGRAGDDWYAEMEVFSRVVARIDGLPQPVIAAVNGPAIGGGLAMALACDTRVCSESARFSAAFVRLGFSGCDMGVSYFLPRTVGSTLAFEMMLTGRIVDAAEAREANLVLRVVPEGEVVEAAVAVARQVSANAPFGVKLTKRVMRTNLDAASLGAAIELENLTQSLCAGTSGHHEALAAFLEKRQPRFREHS